MLRKKREEEEAMRKKKEEEEMLRKKREEEEATKKKKKEEEEEMLKKKREEEEMLRKKKDEEEQNNAAVKLQALMRGFHDRHQIIGKTSIVSKESSDSVEEEEEEDDTKSESNDEEEQDPEEEEEEATLKIGDRVGARYRGGEDYYPGTIVSINEGTYGIDYGSNDIETGVVREHILSYVAAEDEEEEGAQKVADLVYR